MKRTWVVVANAARARLCEFDPRDGSLTELADFTHPAARRKGSDLAPDRPGHAAKGPSGARTSFEAQIHHKERAAFAHELAQHLDLAIAQGRCPALALIASNPFLGELKARLGAASAKAVVATSPTDLTRCTLSELARHAGTLLEAAG